MNRSRRLICTEDAEQMQKGSRFQDDGMNQRFKIRQKALKYEQMRMSDRVVVLPEVNPTPEIEGDIKKEGSTVEMELMRQERSQKDASDNLALKNIKAVLLKLLSQPGLGRICPDPKN